MKNSYEVIGNTVKIRLNRRKKPPLYTIIDLEDFSKVSSFSGSWYAYPTSAKQKTIRYYVARTTTVEELAAGCPTAVKLHRIISDCPNHLHVDHLNHDTLDNRRSNLRNGTQKENNQNRIGWRTRRNPKGYFWCNTKNCWKVVVRMYKGDTRQKQVTFAKEEDAKREAQRRFELRKLLSLKQDDSREEGDRPMAGCSLEGANGSGLVL